MNKHEAFLITTLLHHLADDLANEVARLDEDLPLERNTVTEQEYIGDTIFGVLVKTPKSHPDEFRDVVRDLPHVELDGLRAIEQAIRDLAGGLLDEDAQP